MLAISRGPCPLGLPLPGRNNPASSNLSAGSRAPGLSSCPSWPLKPLQAPWPSYGFCWAGPGESAGVGAGGEQPALFSAQREVGVGAATSKERRRRSGPCQVPRCQVSLGLSGNRGSLRFPLRFDGRVPAGDLGRILCF